MARKCCVCGITAKDGDTYNWYTSEICSASCARIMKGRIDADMRRAYRWGMKNYNRLKKGAR